MKTGAPPTHPVRLGPSSTLTRCTVATRPCASRSTVLPRAEETTVTVWKQGRSLSCGVCLDRRSRYFAVISNIATVVRIVCHCSITGGINTSAGTDCYSSCFVAWLFSIPITFKIISETDLLEQLCVLPHLEVADQTCYLTQSQHTDTELYCPSADPRTPGIWQESH